MIFAFHSTSTQVVRDGVFVRTIARRILSRGGAGDRRFQVHNGRVGVVFSHAKAWGCLTTWNSKWIGRRGKRRSDARRIAYARCGYLAACARRTNTRRLVGGMHCVCPTVNRAACCTQTSSLSFSYGAKLRRRSIVEA